MTLTYDGQESFDDAPVPSVGTVSWTEPDYVLTGVEYDAGTYLGMKMLDATGGLWVVSNVDPLSLDSSTNLEVLADTGYLGDDPGIQWNPDAGKVETVDLTSFDVTTCSGSTAFYRNVQNGNMATTTSPAGANFKSTVMVRAATGSANVVCSGVLIRDDVVLTAAHCITDSNGNFYPTSGDTVCTLENKAGDASGGLAPVCRGVTTAAVSSTWTGTNPYQLNLDYGLLFLNGPTGISPMVITTRSDASAATFADAHVGYPAVNTDCTTNLITDECVRADHRIPAQTRYFATGPANSADFSGAYARWQTSFAGATSGGPHYLLSGSTQELTGIQAAAQDMCGGVYPCATGRGVGPKASAFRTAVLSWMVFAPPVLCPSVEESAFVQPATPTLFQARYISPGTCDPTTGTGPNSSTCGDVVVFQPTAALAGGCSGERPNKLVVYLPGSKKKPSENDFILEMSAYAGYRTIGLSYANTPEVTDFCTARASSGGNTCVPANQQSQYATECLYYSRKERITGVDDSRTAFQTGDPGEFGELGNPTLGTTFPVQDSILYRLLYTLYRLRQADTGNTCGWDSFYNSAALDGHTSGSGNGLALTGVAGNMNWIHWDKVIVAGWSQGSGHAALIGLENTVAGEFLVDGPSDMCNDPTTGVAHVATYVSQLTAGLEPSGAAPRFGEFHLNSCTGTGCDARPTEWDGDPTHTVLGGLRMPVCDDQAWDTTVTAAEPTVNSAGVPWLKRAPFPAVGTSVVAFTDLSAKTAQTPPSGCSPHDSMAVSARNGTNCMPIGPIGTGAPPVGTRATSPEQANLFEAYVQGFCAMSAP